MKKTWGMAVLGLCLSMTVARAQNTQDWTLDVHLLTSIPADRPDVGDGVGWSGQALAANDSALFGRWGQQGTRSYGLHSSESGQSRSVGLRV